MLAAVIPPGERSGVCSGLRSALREDGEHEFSEPGVRNGELSDGITIWSQSSGDGRLYVVSILCRPSLHERLDISSKSGCP